MSTPTKLIREKVAEIELGDEWITPGFCVRHESSKRIVRRGKQIFAIFHGTAYDITPFRDHGIYRLPAIVKGKAYARFPDEGSSGVLSVYIFGPEAAKEYNVRLDRVGKWFCSYAPCGWIHEEELELSNKQIAENIAEEAEMNVFHVISVPSWA